MLSLMLRQSECTLLCFPLAHNSCQSRHSLDAPSYSTCSAFSTQHHEFEEELLCSTHWQATVSASSMQHAVAKLLSVAVLQYAALVLQLVAYCLSIFSALLLLTAVICCAISGIHTSWYVAHHSVLPRHTLSPCLRSFCSIC